MRRRTVAGAVLTVALALVASPGIVGSLTPVDVSPPPVPAREPLLLPVAVLPTVGPLDVSQRATSMLEASANFVVPAVEGDVPAAALLSQPTAAVGSEAKPTPTPRPTPRPTPKPTSPGATGAPVQTLTGWATWYSSSGHTTAMRLPRGTRVRICGASACIDRTIGDYGPAAWTGNLVDLWQDDFPIVCGCGLGTGKVKVTVYVY